jgi:hypothetical protein
MEHQQEITPPSSTNGSTESALTPMSDVSTRQRPAKCKGNGASTSGPDTHVAQHLPVMHKDRITDREALGTHLTQIGQGIKNRCVQYGEPFQLAELKVALALENEALGDPPLSVKDVFRIASQLYSQSATAGAHVAALMRREVYSTKAIEPRSPHPYLVGTSSEGQEGWFPRGEISAVAGPSGGGKTRWLADLIENLELGERTFGRPVNSVPHLFLSYDRSNQSFLRTLRAMGLRQGAINFYRPSKEEAKKEVADFLPELFYRPENRRVGVVIIEGADMKVPRGKIIDLAEVSSYANDLQFFAERLGMHIILTLGAAKMRANDRYSSPRERIIGSTAWGRKLETIVYLEPDQKSDNIRQLTILTRNAAPEEHNFEFKCGRLVEIDDDLPAKTKLEHWINNNLEPGDDFTLDNAQTALKEPKSTVESALARLVGEGKVIKPKRGTYQRPADDRGLVEGMEALGM